jgi:hypothetical protein
MAAEIRELLKGSQRVVIKAGTSVVSTPEGYPSLVRLANIVEQVSHTTWDGVCTFGTGGRAFVFFPIFTGGTVLQAHFIQTIEDVVRHEWGTMWLLHLVLPPQVIISTNTHVYSSNQ